LFEFILKPTAPSATDPFLMVHGRRIPLVIVRNLRARRYLLRLRPDGSARVTIPRHGSAAEGRRFAERHIEWLAGQLEKLAAQPTTAQSWQIGTDLLFRGELVKIEADINNPATAIRFGDVILPVPDINADLRLRMTKHLWRLAIKELPPRTLELATAQQVAVHRVTVRNQRSRWGSCSRRGTISLNWRLIQTPPFVRDYIILHELMHRRQMNHSPRFWQEVARACPDYQTAEKWLKRHSALLK
jgi:predicted metal-dependent hydrolase